MPLESIQHHFSRLAPDYRGLRITDLEPILSIKTRLRGFPSRIIAADIGCGDGRYDLELFHYLGERLFLYCVDSNRQMLNEVDGYLSRHGIRDFKIKQSLDRQLPFEDASLDCLFTFNAIHHFTLPRFLKETERVVKDEGRLLIYTRLRSQNRRSIWGRHFPLFHQMETRLYELWELEDILRTAKNLELEETEYFGYEREASLNRLIERAGITTIPHSRFTPEANSSAAVSSSKRIFEATFQISRTFDGPTKMSFSWPEKARNDPVFNILIPFADSSVQLISPSVCGYQKRSSFPSTRPLA